MVHIGIKITDQQNNMHLNYLPDFDKKKSWNQTSKLYHPVRMLHCVFGNKEKQNNLQIALLKVS